MKYRILRLALTALLFAGTAYAQVPDLLN